MSITPEQRAAWRELANAATPGPWRIECEVFSSHVEIWAGKNRVGSTRYLHVPSSLPDALLITAARTAVPALLDEVDRLTRERDEARARAESARSIFNTHIGNTSKGEDRHV